jgi:hypothetical protein
MKQKEKNPPATAQNEQAPQDENPMTVPPKGRQKSGATLNNPTEIKRKREKQNKANSNRKA